jgi:hypothetical protein
MSSANQQPVKRPLDELAAAIYVELVGRAFLRVENDAVIKPEAAVLAKLSYQLAGVFKTVEKAAQAASGPQNVGYDVQVGDLAGWKA